ncbi:MAG: SDR family NAD(P)-dependent oxidoreductase, partial [Candidatus Latescibacterota bacterium]|nr:SDR family NAD(P)-dependent oxidoreductase [Candidatus Latescibacterota bacterium]
MSALARFGLEGKIVIVTGAGRGIGRTIAMECFQSGAKIAVGSRTTTELETLAAAIEVEGGECFYHLLDVTNVESIQAFMDAVIGHYGQIDVLVNNAGYN